MRVAIRTTHRPGTSGGVEQYVEGLAAGLRDLDGDDGFDFVGTARHELQLRDFLGGRSAFVRLPSRLRDSETLGKLTRTRVGQTTLRVRARARRAAGAPTLRPAPTLVESGPYGVVHFPSQVGELTRHPSIYQPWDLQHLHFPEFFTPDQLELRESVWRSCSERAAYVLVASRFVRDDVVNAFGLEPERVAVVSPGAPTLLHPPVSRPDESVAPPARPFALYPAQTWAHKNHIRLLEAVALLRDRRIEIALVCPGQQNPRLDAVRRHAADLGLQALVRFPGYVSDAHLRHLYEQARCLVFPSLFEGFGFPVLEAFVAGLPVACSSTTSLGELAGDAAVQFEPTDVESIADALALVWTDDGRRAELIRAGETRAEQYTWPRLARSCRALYRSAARASLGAGDADLLVAAGVRS